MLLVPISLLLLLAVVDQNLRKYVHACALARRRISVGDMRKILSLNTDMHTHDVYMNICRNNTYIHTYIHT